MKLSLSFVIALLVAPAFASGTTTDPEDNLAVTVLRIEGKGAYVGWTPAPGVLLYDIYRGPDLDHMAYLASTPNAVYNDFAPLDGDAWYVIVGQVPDHSPFGPVRGKCLMVRGATGVAVTLANCMPGELPFGAPFPLAGV